MPKALTDSMLKTLQPKRGQVGWKESADGGARGLYLRLSPKGEKTWAVRHMVGGKRQRCTIGGYPTVSLADARERAREYLSGAKDGAGAEEVDARKKALTMKLSTAHEDYLMALGSSLRASTAGLKKAMFRDHIAPVIGERLLRMVRRSDVIDVVTKVIGKGYAVQANRVFSELMALLRWCEQKGYIAGVPAIRKRDLRVSGAAKEVPRRRTLSDPEIAEAWREAGDLGRTSSDYLRALMLIGQRRDEVRLMEWRDINLGEAIWTIPAAKYKTKVDHAVPLPPKMVEILRRREAEKDGPYVFGGQKRGKPFNGTLSAQRRLNEAMASRQAFTLHDLRRTCRTTLARLGVDDETAELVIGHLPQGMGKVYNLYDRWDERRAALEKWERFVLSLADGARNVVEFARPAAAAGDAA
jgi:integrase